MPNIVVTNHQDFTQEQKRRLDSLGDVTYYDSLPTGEEYLERIKGADIICSGAAGWKDVYAQLRDVYITVGFVRDHPKITPPTKHQNSPSENRLAREDVSGYVAE